MPERTIAVIRQGYDDSAGFDTGVSHALLRRVSEGSLAETFRISTPGRVVAFAKQDRIAPGFGRATELARHHRFESVIRLPGGRAAVFHERTISFSWTVPHPDPVRGIRRRFTQTAAVLTTALASIGIETAVGEIPGEYCPGEFSLNHAGTIKLAGIGQRLIRGAAHVGGVLVVGNAREIREVLVPVYDALSLEWDPSTVGALDDLAPGVDNDAVTDAIVGALATTATTMTATLDDETLELARALAPMHTP
ncbi:MAG: lipoate--protein ligase family protein [Actinomycetota bacterium]|nr:lipoate--protein ligase family protein [Actinomycetota bacterium]